MHIDALEAIWIISNGIAFIFTLIALADARKSKQLATRESVARQIVANGNVRREILRLLVQTLLLCLVVPGLFSDEPTPISFFVVVLLIIPILLLISTIFDYIERRALASEVWDEIESEHRLGMDRIESGVSRNQTSIEENTRLTRESGMSSLAAYHEAQKTNRRLDKRETDDNG